VIVNAARGGGYATCASRVGGWFRDAIPLVYAK
jgi:hypothetical protein